MLSELLDDVRVRERETEKKKKTLMFNSNVEAFLNLMVIALYSNFFFFSIHEFAIFLHKALLKNHNF